MAGIKQVNAKEVKRYFDDTNGTPPKPYSALNIIQNDRQRIDFNAKRTPSMDYDSHKYSTSNILTAARQEVLNHSSLPVKKFGVASIRKSLKKPDLG